MGEEKLVHAREEETVSRGKVTVLFFFSKLRRKGEERMNLQYVVGCLMSFSIWKGTLIYGD